MHRMLSHKRVLVWKTKQLQHAERLDERKDSVFKRVNGMLYAYANSCPEKKALARPMGEGRCTFPKIYI